MSARRAAGRAARAGAADAITAGLLPVLLWQGRQVMRGMPDVPEAPGARAGRAPPRDPPRASPQPAARDAFHLLVIGESTAAGVGAPHQREALASRTAEALSVRVGVPVRWHMVGRSGLRAAEVRRYLVPLIPPPRQPTDLAVVVLGVNDTRGLTRPRAWRRHMRALVDEVRERAQARHVLCTGVPPMGDFPALPRPLRDVLGRRARVMDESLSRALSDLSWATHVPFHMALRPHLFCEDGLHPGPAGYQAWGELLAAHAPADRAARHGLRAR